MKSSVPRAAVFLLMLLYLSIFGFLWMTNPTVGWTLVVAAFFVLTCWSGAQFVRGVIRS